MQINFGEKKEFKLVKEGTVDLTITNVELKPESTPTDAYITFEDKVDGGYINGRYSFNKNEPSNKILGVLVSIVVNKGEWVETIDSDDLLSMKGLVLNCEVVHTQGKKAREDGTFPTFANIKHFNHLVEQKDDVEDLF